MNRASQKVEFLTVCNLNLVTALEVDGLTGSPKATKCRNILKSPKCFPGHAVFAIGGGMATSSQRPSL
jgi:hypothetical protein